MSRRPRRLGKSKPPVGARPGTLVVDPHAPASRVRLIRYTQDRFEELEVEDPAIVERALASGDKCWVDVQGLGTHEIIESLGEIFTIHPLALEDVVNVPLRPKAESYPTSLLFITRMIQAAGRLDIHSEQVSILVGSHWVLTFQESYGDVLDPVRARLRTGNRRIRESGADYLAYAILDTIVDAYYPVIDGLADELEEMEDLVMTRPTPATLQRLNRAKNALVRVRRAVAPQREAVHSLLRDVNPFLTEETRLFLRDTYDHCLSSSEALENSREFVNGLMNTYLSVVSNRMNEVMKTLTIVASIFVPLTFMAGLYGMNFEYMPELGWRGSYPTLLAAMVVVAGLMVWFFWRRGWIGSGPDSSPDED